MRETHFFMDNHCHKVAMQLNHHYIDQKIQVLVEKTIISFIWIYSISVLLCLI
ncbi:hypothetical protein Patl1_17111 [Pistacia atlantica]|uniref:Uncharacterized protein n=1 Tax=Pistacia atlantica TaxID=434234 RepID=A0ACC1B6Z9_9ROSI|nr:hypothetical protein Patl1_17111 [Pistacia atlantica]